MDKVDAKYPQFIRIDSDKHDKFLEPLISLPGSTFYKREKGEVYMMAVVFGFNNQLREKTKKSKEIRVYQGLSDSYKLLIRIIALSTENYDYESLYDGNKTLKTIEEYANGGVSVLYDKVVQGDIDFSLEESIWNEVKEAQGVHA